MGGYTKPLDSYLKLKDILQQEPDRHSGTVLGYDLPTAAQIAATALPDRHSGSGLIKRQKSESGNWKSGAETGIRVLALHEKRGFHLSVLIDVRS